MATQPTTGDGTTGNRYLIETAEHVDYLRVEPAAHYRFNNRDTIDLGIDLADAGSDFYNSGEGWIPIGEDVGGNFSFTGTIEGNGAKITNININRNGGLQALFRDLDGCTINDLQTSGDVTTDDQNSGILFATAQESARINRCKQMGTVLNNRAFGAAQTGGFGGFLNNGEIRDSYSEVDASDGGDGNGRLGSFIGRALADDGSFPGKITIDRCYSDGVVSGTDADGFGLGAQLGGGLAADNSFWNTELSTKSTGDFPIGLTGITTAQFTDISNFTGAGWDIVAEASHDGQLSTSVWYHDGTKPRLWYELPLSTEYSGNFSPDSTAVQDANVYLTVSDDEAFTNGETYYTTTDANGDWTIAQTPDDTKFVRVDIDYDDAGTRKQVSFYYDPT